MSTIQVSHLWRYPVKSMAGEALERATLGPNGIPGDRAWAIKDEARGGIHGGKRFPVLMSCSGRFVSEPTEAQRSPPVQISGPGGFSTRSDTGEVNAALSELVGANVSLWPLLPASQLEHYRRAAPEPDADMEASLRAVFAREPHEPLPDLSQFPAELFEFDSPPGTYFDAYPILIMSRATLDALGTAAPDSNFDVRRFRPNLMVTGDETPYFENAWVGRTLRIGDAVLKVEMACPRCIMTTHGFDELPRDASIMRTLVQQNSGNAGVYATVKEPGTIHAGDAVTVQ